MNKAALISTLKIVTLCVIFLFGYVGWLIFFNRLIGDVSLLILPAIMVSYWIQRGVMFVYREECKKHSNV